MTTKTPKVPVNFVPAKTRDSFSLGGGNLVCRILEDGSQTGAQIGVAELTLPPGMKGPPAHWHEMHNEMFYTTKGTVRFHIPGKDPIDAKTGDFVSVPSRAPHTLSNSFNEEAKFGNTYTPAFYINYFKILSELIEDGKGMTPEKNMKVMASFATLIVPKEGMAEQKERKL